MKKAPTSLAWAGRLGLPPPPAQPRPTLSCLVAASASAQRGYMYMH